MSPAGRDDVEVYAVDAYPDRKSERELADFEEVENFGHGTKCDTWPMSSVRIRAGKR